MTKWFDTNYHYLVPELTAATVFCADARKPLGEWREALAHGIPHPAGAARAGDLPCSSPSASTARIPSICCRT